jgi:hypothetical protein
VTATRTSVIETAGPMRDVVAFEVTPRGRVEHLAPCRHVVVNQGEAQRRRCPHCRDAMRVRHAAALRARAAGVRS